MLRNWGEKGGIGVYTSNLLNALLKLNQSHKYIFIYYSPEFIGQFSHVSSVKEVMLNAPNKLWWDQVAIPQLVKKEKLDVIYNPKLSIPIFSNCKKVLVMHGAEQFAVPHAFPLADRIYFSLANRLYCQRADSIISMTQQGKSDIVRYMGADPKKVQVIHESYNERCRVLSVDETKSVKEKYSLPEKFILFVGGLTPIKNFKNLLFAFHKIYNKYSHRLVVVGFHRFKFSKDLQLVKELKLTDYVDFLGFIPDEELPIIYNLADLFLFPSLYEGFGLPILEAMACGCPVITSQTGCSPEVAGGAAVLVDPYNPTHIAEGIEKVLCDEGVRNRLIEKGLQRVKDFSWEKCAQQTLELFESLGALPAVH